MITKFPGFLLTTSLDLLARREGLHLGTRTFLPMSTLVQYAPLHIFFSFVFFLQMVCYGTFPLGDRNSH